MAIEFDVMIPRKLSAMGCVWFCRRLRLGFAQRHSFPFELASPGLCSIPSVFHLSTRCLSRSLSLRPWSCTVSGSSHFSPVFHRPFIRRSHFAYPKVWSLKDKWKIQDRFMLLYIFVQMRKTDRWKLKLKLVSTSTHFICVLRVLLYYKFWRKGIYFKPSSVAAQSISFWWDVTGPGRLGKHLHSSPPWRPKTDQADGIAPFERLYAKL